MKTAKKTTTTKAARGGALRKGTRVFIRTVTSYYTGEILEVNEHEIVLVSAAWIADTGRFTQAMQTGEFSEVEPYPDDMQVSVNRGAIADIVRGWPHPLPRVQK